VGVAGLAGAEGGVGGVGGACTGVADLANNFAGVSKPPGAQVATHTWLEGLVSPATIGPRWLVHIMSEPSSLNAGSTSAPVEWVIRARASIDAGTSRPPGGGASTANTS
jgi:hypothetical protein